MTNPSGKAPSRRWLYGPFILFVLLFGAYSAYWFFLHGQLKTGIDDWIAEQRAAGLEVNFTDKRLHGYPYRFALTVDDPQMADPQAGTAWRGEKLQIIMQPWNFNHAIIRSSGRNEIAPGNGQDMTAVLGRKSAASLNWDETGITHFGLTLDTADIVTAGGDFGLSGLLASFAPTPDASGANRLSLDWESISLDANLLDGTDAAFLGTEIQASRLRLEGQGFSVFGDTPVRKAEIAQLVLNWGPLKFGAKGQFDINPNGYPDGVLQVRLDETEALKDALDAAGLLRGDTGALLQVIAAGSANGGFVPVPFRDGAVTYFGQSIAPVPQIAPAIVAPE